MVVVVGGGQSVHEPIIKVQSEGRLSFFPSPTPSILPNLIITFHLCLPFLSTFAPSLALAACFTCNFAPGFSRPLHLVYRFVFDTIDDWPIEVDWPPSLALIDFFDSSKITV